MHPAELIRNRPAKGIHGHIDPEYTAVLEKVAAPSFVATIPGGHVVGEHGIVVTPDGFRLAEVSRPSGAFIIGEHGDVTGPAAFAADFRVVPHHLDGTAAVLSTFFGRGYFHWLYDVLPRVGLIAEAGIKDIDHFILPTYFARFQIETLSALGISRGRVVTSFRHRHLLADRLVVPSLPRQSGVFPTWVCDFLRSSFPPVEPRHEFAPQRLYITRRATDHGILANEDSLSGRLLREGFTPVALERFTLREKAWLMGNAEVVIGPSGGGLCNIVFCRPGTKVIELRVQPYPVMEAWHIANRVGLDFWDVLPEGYRRSEATFTTGSLSADTVLTTLEKAGCIT